MTEHEPNTATRSFTRGEVESCERISDSIASYDRSSYEHHLVFRFSGQAREEAWRITYVVGAAQPPDVGPWASAGVAEATLVRAAPATIVAWQPVTTRPMAEEEEESDVQMQGTRE